MNDIFCAFDGRPEALVVAQGALIFDAYPAASDDRFLTGLLPGRPAELLANPNQMLYACQGTALDRRDRN